MRQLWLDPERAERAPCSRSAAAARSARSRTYCGSSEALTSIVLSLLRNIVDDDPDQNQPRADWKRRHHLRRPVLRPPCWLKGFRTPSARNPSCADGVRKPRMRAGKSTYKFRSRGTPICETGCAPCQPRIRWDFAIPNHDPSIREKEFLAAGPFFTTAPSWVLGFLRRPPAVDWN
jgi:hypothetical protein